MTSCESEKRAGEYSKDFYSSITESGIELKNDSLFFPVDAHIDPILIPTKLDLKTEYIFKNKNGLKIKIKRENYTDLRFEIIDKEIIDKGIVSLRPTFYLGSESIGTEKGEFWVDVYDIVESKSNLINTIGIGNHELTDEKPRNIFVHLYVNSDNQLERLKNADGLWEQK